MKGKCNYKKVTVTFDLDFPPEKAMLTWLEDRQTAYKDRLSDLMKAGLKLLMDSIDEPLKH